MSENLKIRVDDLELSIRCMNALIEAEIHTVKDILTKSEEELLRIPNFGRKSLNEVKEILSVMGFSLGMIEEEKEEKPDLLQNLKFEIISKTEEAFKKSHNSVVEMRKKNKISLKEVNEVFDAHRRITDAFAQSLRDIFY